MKRWVKGLIGILIVLVIGFIFLILNMSSSKIIPIKGTWTKGGCTYTINGWVDVSFFPSLNVNCYSISITSSNPEKCGGGKFETKCE